jgi:NTP pyrophosphatase (non-canonical NTP hydrolase)
MIAFREAQRRAWANKVTKGFNTTDVALEFGLTMEELAEAFSAWRKGKPSLGEELADTAIFLLGLAEMTGASLDAEVSRKLAINEQRVYEQLPNGTNVKVQALGGPQ